MNPNAKAWVAALRSGKYEQGRHALNRNNKFCCLGVLCEVAIERGLPIKKTQQGSSVAYDGFLAAPSEAVYQWAGIDRSGVSTLARKNDDGATFEQIARYIESEPPGLFTQNANFTGE